MMDAESSDYDKGGLTIVKGVNPDRLALVRPSLAIERRRLNALGLFICFRLFVCLSPKCVH